MFEFPLSLRHALVAVVLAAASGTAVRAQTDVCGPITDDTVWSTAGSPYTVTCNVTVRNDATLTVEPGVEIRFDPGTTLWIGTAALGGGTLIADADGGPPILFTSSASSPAPGNWSGVEFLDSAVGATFSGDAYVSGSILRGCTLEYANTAVKVRSHPAVSGCLIRNCSAAAITVKGTLPDTVRVIGCAIEDNGAGISPGGQAGGIEHADSGGWVRVSDCEIRRNAGVFAGAISVASGMEIRGTRIVDNRAGLLTQAGGIRSVSGNLVMRCTTIGDNDGWGIVLTSSTSGVDADSLSLFGNASGAVSNQTPENVDLTDTWWAAADSASVADQVEDCYDSPFYGCVTFMPFLAGPACDAATAVRSEMRASSWGRVKAAYR
jgi:hypothetical protein